VIELNPILTRESRARWRHHAFLLLFFGAAIFALIMYFCYDNAIARYGLQGSQFRKIEQQSSEVGAALFQQLTYYQVIGWMLLAPTLTATTIAFEREHGLLEGLQLSQLTPGAIVRGKLYSALTFAGLLLLCTMPIIALCFILGGVSPGEFFGATTQTFLAILLGVCMGLWVSSRSRRASHAVGGTFALVFLWGFGTAIALAIASIPGLAAEWKVLLSALSLVNPGLTMTMWWQSVPGLMPPVLAVSTEPWLLGWILQAALSALLLWLCIGPVKRPFDEQYWVEIGPGTDVLELTTAQARHESKTGRKLKTRALRGQWELPLARHIRLENPIMQRDLRAKFIFRRASLWGLLWQSIIILVAAAIYILMLWFAWTQIDVGKFMFPGWTFGIAFVTLLVPAIIGAGAFTRERESGTWEGIHLSLLSPLEIILGKQIGAIAIAPLASLILNPFVLPFLRESSGNVFSPNTHWSQVIMAFVFIFVLAWFSAAWGLRISWSSRKTASATAWTIGSLFIALVIAPPFIIWFIIWLLETFVSLFSDVWSWHWLEPLHPLGCFTSIFEGHSSDSLSQAALGCAFLFGFGCLLLLSLWRQMKKGCD
jgi:ABC-type transport system involved in multi-copper enzyme maturation permease subunit